MTAVDAIGDKADVNLAVQWLIDEGEEDHGGAVEFVRCTHLTLQLTLRLSRTLTPTLTLALTLTPTLTLTLTRCAASTSMTPRSL